MVMAGDLRLCGISGHRDLTLLAPWKVESSLDGGPSLIDVRMNHPGCNATDLDMFTSSGRRGPIFTLWAEILLLVQ